MVVAGAALAPGAAATAAAAAAAPVPAAARNVRRVASDMRISFAGRDRLVAAALGGASRRMRGSDAGVTHLTFGALSGPDGSVSEKVASPAQR
ncbi:hypothetical protein GCM10009867_25250 [Pedococcus aerophilus]|uniref:Uncharacterized protein n=1 Tax=Pedococcus aerophilus TaxID=436356 RepID=A0ABN3URG2_9MICO